MRHLTKGEERVAAAIGYAILGAVVGWIGFGGWGLIVLALLGAWVGCAEEPR